MAFIHPVISKIGESFPEAYHRVESVSLQTKTLMDFEVRLYDKQGSDVWFDVDYFDCPYDIAGENPIKQAYMYLRSLSQFADAIDVLEETQG